MRNRMKSKDCIGQKWVWMQMTKKLKMRQKIIHLIHKWNSKTNIQELTSHSHFKLHGHQHMPSTSRSRWHFELLPFCISISKKEKGKKMVQFFLSEDMSWKFQITRQNLLPGSYSCKWAKKHHILYGKICPSPLFP